MTQPTNDSHVLMTPATQVRVERPRFLMQDLVPLQVLSLLTGIAGEGKSSLALHWAALATTGKLPGEFFGEPINVVISATEDAKSYQIARLTAAGANLDRVTFMDMGIMVAGEIVEQPIIFPRDMVKIREQLHYAGARLWIIDPVTGIIPGDSNNRDAVRQALDPLHALARDLDMSVLGVAHFTKGQGRSRDKISGSHAFRDVARAHIPLVRDEEAGNRIYTLEKSNYSTATGKSWSFDLVDTEVTTSDGEIMNVGRVVDLGESDLTVDQVINRNPESEEGGEDRNAAQEFLLDYLTEQGGEAKAGDALKAARAAGFNENEIKNARKRSKEPRVVSRKAGGKGVGWVWALDDSDTFDFSPSDQQKIGVEDSKVSKVSRTGDSDTFEHRAPIFQRDSNEKSKVSPQTRNDTFETTRQPTLQVVPDPVAARILTAEDLGTVVGEHPAYGPVLYTKAGLVPQGTSGYQAWATAGKPDLSEVIAA